jgi:hypothetical protein
MMKKLFVMMVVINAVTWQGCESEVIPGPVDCNENPVILELGTVQDSDCDVMNGSIEVIASGGSGKYMFQLGGEDLQISSVFNGVGPGLYEIEVVDENNCSATLEVTVINKSGVNITFTSTEAGCKTSNGTLTVMTFGGTEPYAFKLGQGNFTASNTFTDLPSGEHHLTVKDASGCEVNQLVRIKSGISFSGSISGIIENNCTIDDCHNGTQFPDFRVFKNIHDNAPEVKRLTQDGTMPEDGALTQEQIDLIACWVDDGALAN